MIQAARRAPVLWALSWGEHACMLAPTELVKRVRQTVRLMGAAYGS
jgi:predicted DNA-binding transcriptional regulator YafY